MNNTETKTLSKSAQIKIINELYSSVYRACQSAHYFDKLHDMVETSERQHRKFSGNNGLSIANAVRYFCIKHIIEGKTEKKPDIKNIIHYRLEVFIGYGVYIHHKEQLKKVFKPSIVKQFALVDYAELMK